jgi:DNA-binding NtrC family response regulator
MRQSKVSEEALRGAISSTDGNVTRAAKHLGVSLMQVHRLLDKHGLRSFARDLRVKRQGSATGRPPN